VGDLFTPVHLIIVLGIALLVFGPKRLPELGQGLGKSLREFREATSGMSNAFGQENFMGTQRPQPQPFMGPMGPMTPGAPTNFQAATLPAQAVAAPAPAPAVPEDMDTGG
jgi:sec-independent protein translocase protein TatA